MAPARRWLRPRRVAAVAGGALLTGLLGVGCEAAWRAHLGPVAARAPTLLYTRPVPWGDNGGAHQPVPIVALDARLAEYREPVTLAALPDHLIDAVLAVEDRRFHDHGGIDVRRVVGAAVANLRAGEITQGGSTITQQLAKNLFLSSRRTPLRKLREAAMAVMLEDRYGKAEILSAYLNEIYLGQDGPVAIHGIGAAASCYFGKDARDLTLAEAALLAGMIRAPNRYAPARHPERARARRNLVLDLMVAQGRVSAGAAERAAAGRVRVRAGCPARLDARYFRDFVVARLDGEYGGAVPPRGAAVYTTLDGRLQQAARGAVQDGLTALGRRGRGVQAALVALDPRTGDVLAMVGGRDYGTSQFNRAVHARRQPGSAFKPVVALAAVGRDGRRDPAFTLASVLRDEPLRVETGAGVWEPANYDEGFRGPVTLREALEQSLNVPFARLGLAVGPERIVTTGRALGIESRLHAVPALALGASEVTPLELTRAYGVLAAGGRLAPTRTLLSIAVAGSEPREVRARTPARVADAAETYLVTSALQGVVERGTGRALGRIGYRGDLAGKSGTSSDWRDGWFVAYTPALVVGVWVGHDDGRSLGVSGSGSALPIAARFLRDALRRDRGPAFEVPAGIEFASVARRSAWGWGWVCTGQPEAFLQGTAPEDRCGSPWQADRWVVRLDDRAGWLADELAEALGERADALLELLDERGDEVIALLAERLADRTRRALRVH